MKTPGEWAVDLQLQLRALDDTPASTHAKKKTIKESQRLAHQLVRSQALTGVERRALIREYSKAIRTVAIEEMQREFTLQHAKMLQRAETKREQREKKWAASNARRLSRTKKMRSNTAPLTSGGIAILLFLFAPLSLCGLWQFGSVFWAGLQTGELIFNSCRTPLSSCLSHIVQAHEPFYFYSGMAVFLFATLLCALMLLGIALSLSQAGNTPEKKQ
ncbi:hypothetical protein B9T65_12840 [Serratia marcescens]|uniref:hypothetical protein n=1 Tax=Serratia TaxID=613 RepID=UPI0006ECE873|nr:MULTISPECIES: hypothetical protein [Serratia]ALL36708.1 hypothetical protein AR325_06935 [Serratia marcescens]MDV5742093.1 hypothetical protein [Serratia marcescens]MDV5747004.1 hypothetical protein [Serratia marcescens]MDV5778440.1 hypothetical protein [Serratia marcescens]MDV5783382.1 hypothetical protein [Serratia marcescens]